jgi:hypothetical protein
VRLRNRKVTADPFNALRERYERPRVSPGAARERAHMLAFCRVIIHAAQQSRAWWLKQLAMFGSSRLMVAKRPVREGEIVFASDVERFL